MHLPQIARYAHVLVRYTLAIGILPYGISKLFLFQFQVSPWDYTQPLGETPGTILTWSFLGYSAWFQRLLGVLEVAPAVLLLFRRTWRLGALLLLPVLLNVVLTNFALDLWPQTKTISLGLLGLNAILLVTDAARYRAFLRALLAASPRHRLLSITEGLLGVVIVGLFFVYVGYSLGSRARVVRDFAGAPEINGAGTWAVEELDFPGAVSPSAERTYYFDLWNRAYLTVGETSYEGSFWADPKARTFELRGLEPELLNGTYETGPESLTLTGMHAGEPFRILLQRKNWGTPTRVRGSAGE